MSPPPLARLTATHLHLPDHCNPTSEYLFVLSSAFQTCVPTDLAFVSTALGVFSIISWLFAQLPQIYKNYKLQSASGLSIFFLGEWLLGDLANLVGALLTEQALWQVVVAAYYVTVDICLVGQYIWYSHVKTWRKGRLVEYDPGEDEDEETGRSRAVLLGIPPPDNNGLVEIVGAVDGKDASATNPPTETANDQGPYDETDDSIGLREKLQAFSFKRTPYRPRHTNPLSPSPRSLLLVSVLCVALSTASPLNPSDARRTTTPPPSTAEFIGRILSWISTFLYLISRLPQIYKNAMRRSTSGLSPVLFIAAFFGNLFYSSSILANPLAWSSYPPFGAHGWVGPEGSDRATWVGLAAPFWLGAAGVLALDATVGIQFLVYGEGREMEVLVEDRKGRDRWRRVTGWMRGWVPSPNPLLRGEGMDDERRVLVERRDSRSSGYGAT